MKKITLFSIIISLIVGILLENKFHVLQNLLSKNGKDKVTEAPIWRDEFKIVDVKSPIDGTLQQAYF